MKYLLPLIMLLAVASGCRNHDTRIFRWAPLLPEADTLVQRLDMSLARYTTPDSILADVERLERIAARNAGIPQLARRAAYFRMRYLYRIDLPDSAAACSAILYDGADSTAYPYDHARAVLARDSLYYLGVVNDYVSTTQILDYARSTRDPFLEATALISIDRYNTLFDDRSPSDTSWVTRAIDIYDDIGFHELTTRLQLNLANRYISCGDSVRGAEILVSLMSNPLVINDTLVQLKAMLNMAFLTRDPSWCTSGLKLLAPHRDSSRFRTMEISLAAMEMRYSIERGDIAAGDSIGRAWSFYEFDHEDIENAIQFQWFNADRLYREGKADSAFAMLRDCVVNERILHNNVNVSEARRNEVRHQIAAMKIRTERNMANERLKWMLAITLLVTASLALYTVVNRRLQRERMKKHAAMLERHRYLLELESHRRRLTSVTLAMDEKDNLLQKLLNEINSLQTDRRLTPADARQLSMAIQTHLGGRQEWEQFRTLFDKVHPSFARNLHRRYPTLTEGDIRIAIYIKLGMSTKQIARMLSLQPESVKKNRHRLRERMGLPPDASLEETLRTLD